VLADPEDLEFDWVLTKKVTRNQQASTEAAVPSRLVSGTSNDKLTGPVSGALYHFRGEAARVIEECLQCLDSLT